VDVIAPGIRQLDTLLGGMDRMTAGFLIDGDKARGRPVGLAVDGHGALLIADDTGNSVWRVSAASP